MGCAMEILYQNANILVCIKPARVLSTDEPGGLPELVREALGDPKADVRTVHRLDRVVSGVMVLARNADAASELSRQIREDQFRKEYLAVVHGKPENPEGTFRDLLARDKARRMTFVAEAPGKGVQEAALSYRVLEYANGMSLVRVRLHTGRTHQIRVQFASRRHPLYGDGKYGSRQKGSIALQSCGLRFVHPDTGKPMAFSLPLPAAAPWKEFLELGE